MSRFLRFCPLQYIEGLLWETYFQYSEKERGLVSGVPRKSGYQNDMRGVYI